MLSYVQRRIGKAPGVSPGFPCGKCILIVWSIPVALQRHQQGSRLGTVAGGKHEVPRGRVRAHRRDQWQSCTLAPPGAALDGVAPATWPENGVKVSGMSHGSGGRRWGGRSLTPMGRAVQSGALRTDVPGPCKAGSDPLDKALPHVRSGQSICATA
jgi:hypothetical protein